MYQALLLLKKKYQIKFWDKLMREIIIIIIIFGERLRVQFLALAIMCWASCSAVSSIWIPPCPLSESIMAFVQKEFTISLRIIIR